MCNKNVTTYFWMTIDRVKGGVTLKVFFPIMHQNLAETLSAIDKENRNNCFLSSSSNNFMVPLKAWHMWMEMQMFKSYAYKILDDDPFHMSNL